MLNEVKHLRAGSAKNLKAFKEILRRLRLLRMTTETYSTVCFMSDPNLTFN